MLERARNMSGHDLAMTLFLEHPGFFRWAVIWFNLDSSARLKDYEGRYAATVTATPENKERLREALAAFLHDRGHGTNCTVEDYQAADKLALVVYHEDYAKAVNQFESGQLVARVQRPVVKVAGVFYGATC